MYKKKATFLFNLIDIDYLMYFYVINNGPFILKRGFRQPQLNWCIISRAVNQLKYLFMINP